MMEWILSSCVLILFIIGIRKVFRKKLDARVLYALWLLVAVRLLIPVSFSESPLSIQNFIREDVVLEQENSTAGKPVESGAFGTDSAGGNMEGDFVPDIDFAEGNDQVWDALGESGSFNEAEHHKVPVDSTASMSQAEENISWPDESMTEKPDRLPEKLLQKVESAFRSGALYRVLTYIWLIGIVVSMLLVMITNVQYRTAVYASRIQKDCADSKLPVYLSEKVSTPCMFGIIHPAIYLTEDTLVKEKVFKYILCHENTHYRHRDNWWAVVRALCVCVHWYNPLVWLAARYSKQDCELACDAETLEQLNADEKIDYGRVLLAFSISDRSVYDRLQLATSMSGGKKQLKERLQMIVREPKRYVWALVVVVLLVGVGIGVTFTGRASGAEATIPASNRAEATEEPQASTEPEGDGEVLTTKEPEATAEPEMEPTKEPETTEPTGTTESPQPTEEPKQSLWGYAEYTGYMDECYTYSYEAFSNLDYDEDGLIDRIWRESIEDGALCSYRIDFGNGDVLLAEKIGGGMPYIKTGDLDGDGVKEILVGVAYGYSSDPDSYGEWAVYKKNGSSYEMLKLPGHLADYEEDGNGGVLPAYQAVLPLKIEDLGNYQTRIRCVDSDIPGTYHPETDGEPLLDVVVSFDEKTWIGDGIGGYIRTGNIGVDRRYTHGNIFSAEIVEEPVPMLRTRASMFFKWCLDEIITTFVLKDGEFQINSMEYEHNGSLIQRVDMKDGKEYQLEVVCTYMAGSKQQRVSSIYLWEIVDGYHEPVSSVDLKAVTAREWGKAQAVWGNEGSLIIIEDFNFDGYEDLAVQGWTGAKNIPYYCFLLNPVSRQYEYSALIPNVEVDKENQLVISYTNDGGGQYSTTYYKYDDKNQLHMVRYVVENLSPEAALLKLDLTYYGDDTYALQAVDRYNEKTASYEGVRVGELTYYAKKALEELYEYSGYRVEQAYFTVYESGIVAFGQTLEDMQKNRHFYSRCFDELGPMAADISSMTLATERDVWYSPVIQWNVPELYEKMTDEELVQWFFRQAPIAGGEEINYMEENFEGNFLIETESGNWYEVGYNAEKRLVSSIYGPYPEYPTH